MKTFNICFLLFTLISCSYQQALPKIDANSNAGVTKQISTQKGGFDKNYFVGHWNAVGYSCTKDSPKVEKIAVTRKGNVVSGIKLNGDECVAKGAQTFQFNQTDKLHRGQVIGKCNFTIGAPGVPKNKTQLANVTIIDLNSFSVGHHTFYRIMGKNYHPDGVYINMTSMAGTGSFAGDVA